MSCTAFPAMTLFADEGNEIMFGGADDDRIRTGGAAGFLMNSATLREDRHSRLFGFGLPRLPRGPYEPFDLRYCGSVGAQLAPCVVKNVANQTKRIVIGNPVFLCDLPSKGTQNTTTSVSAQCCADGPFSHR